MYDSIIIGGGPAGMAAAVYFARQKMAIAMFAGSLGGQVIWSSDVENYLGIHNVSGVKLVELFHHHLDDYKKDIDLFEQEEVVAVNRIEGGFEIKTSIRSYQTKTVLIATGAKHRKLHVSGEDQFNGKGITYCATCEAPLLKGKNVAVIGGGNSAMDAAILTAKYADHVTMYVAGNELKGDAVLKTRCENHYRITLVTNAHVIEFAGHERLESILYQQGDITQRKSHPSAIIEIGLEASSQMIDFVAKTASNEIIVDGTGRTNVDGIWAAGDVTSTPVKQVAVAVGDGSRASIDIIRYLQSHPSHL